MILTPVLVLWLAYGLTPVSWGWVGVLVAIEMSGHFCLALVRMVVGRRVK